MKTVAFTPIARPTETEARAMIDHARRLRAEALSRMLRAAWSRIAHRPAGAMPHAHA